MLTFVVQPPGATAKNAQLVAYVLAGLGLLAWAVAGYVAGRGAISRPCDAADPGRDRGRRGLRLHRGWGLVVNEAMAAGVLPVVSDRVGCGPDLVEGIGEVYSCGDVGALTAALSRALARTRDPRLADELRQHVARYDVTVTAAGFEYAAAAITAGTMPGARTNARSGSAV